MDLEPLLTPGAAWLHVTTASPAEVADAVAALNRRGGMAGRVLRGHKMRTAPALFDEVAAALQFPPYFGENWDALDECLADLGWLPADAYVLAITGAQEVLGHGQPAERKSFWELLARVAGDPGAGPRPPRTFRVLAQCPAGDLGRLPAEGTPFPATTRA